MKLNGKVNVIERSGDFEQSNYTIEATAKAFSILSDQLYSNKVRAVIRELSTNAYDSHVDAGKSDTPFEVHLPSSMEPHFAIRDYGTGLGHSDCMHLYTTYFRSNRTDSNDAVGCMGLGSKSPFAYSDSFTVESFFNGEHRTYNAYKNEEDEPVFALLNTQPTSEANGLKISFPVTSDTYDNDFEEFGEEAADLYKYFEVQPKITGQSIEIKPDEFIIEGDGWAVRKSNGSYGAYALMGQVAYPIDVDQFDNSKDRETRSILQTNLNITFGIGELSITPSRESLSYNKHTIASIIKRCAEIKDNAEKVASEAVSEADTLWDARLSYVSITKSSGLLGGLASAISIDTAEWNGTQLFKDTDYHNIYIGDIPDLTVTVYYRDGWKKAVQRDDVSKLNVSPDCVFYIDDLKRGGISRIRAKVSDETNSGRDAYWNGGRNDKFKIYRVKGTGEAISKFRKLLGCNDSHFCKTSDLDAAVRYSSGNSESRTSIAKWNGSTRSWKKGDNWDDVSIDLNDGGYFVEINRYELEDTRGCYGDLSTLEFIVDCLNNLGHDIDKDKIYGVKTAVRGRNKFNKLEHLEGKWKNIFALGREVIEKLLEDGYRELIQEKRSNRDLFDSSNLKCRVDDIEKIVKETTTDNDLKGLLILHKHLIEDGSIKMEVEEDQKLHNTYELARKYNLLPDLKASKHEPHVKAILKKYPLIRLCSDTRYYEPIEQKETITELARYVDFIERENNA